MSTKDTKPGRETAAEKTDETKPGTGAAGDQTKQDRELSPNELHDVSGGARPSGPTPIPYPNDGTAN